MNIEITTENPATPPHAFFPFPEIRPAQQRALDAWTNAMLKDKRFAVFELPTGAGKSPLAYAIGRWAEHATLQGTSERTQPGAYILTTQKSLQQQYMRDFAEQGMRELRGAGNYPCATHDTDCSTGAEMNRGNKALLKAKNVTDPDYGRFKEEHLCECLSCPYKQAKADFQTAPLGVTNFSYLLAEANHVGQLPPRSLLIVDEAHNTESQLLSFVNLEVTHARCDKIGAQRPPAIHSGDTAFARDWCMKTFMPVLEMKLREAQEARDNEANSEARKLLIATVRGMEQYHSRLKILENTQSLDEWYACTDEKTGALRIRPLTARSIAEDYLFSMGHKLLFLSATILDGKSFIRGLGLSGPDGGFLRVASDFPVENRLVHIWPAGSMSFKKKEQTTPRLVRYIEKILDRHPDEKGLIHTNSYSLTNDVLDHLQQTKHRSRLIFHDNLRGSRESAIYRHTTTPEPTVLISPSMTEGLDLSEDLSRFQVISKVPYPYLGDPFVKARMTHDPAWYLWSTALTIVQATGRSIRSKEDRATTYILDSDVETFLAQADSILPDWWKRALIYH